MTREEMLLKAKNAQSAEELFLISKEFNISITEEQARVYFDQTHKTGELSDDELDNVSGGGCGGNKDSAEAPQMEYYGMKEYTLLVGDTFCPNCHFDTERQNYGYLCFGSTRNSFQVQCAYCNVKSPEKQGDPAAHGYRKA